MTTLVRGTNSYFMGAQAFLIDEERRETASAWASNHIQPNPAIKWVLGRFVEANNPNSNRQAWSLEDLRMARPTIKNAPMNMLHQMHNIVGSFVATEMIYPTDALYVPDDEDNDEKDDDEKEHAYASINNPYVEALGAFWRYYFPEQLKEVQKAHDAGALFFSMECVAESVTFENPSNGETETFPYKGPFSDVYGDWNNDRSAIRWLNKPTFLAGALILPPTKPGWSNAEVKSIANFVEQHQELAEDVYNDVERQVPHLSSEQIEQITFGLLKGQVNEETANLITNSNRIGFSPNNVTDENSDDDASDVSHQEGGDMSTKTYTEDELKAAVADAIAPVQAELEQLRAKADADAVEAQIAELKEEFAAEKEELQKALDAATIEAQTAKEERDAVVAWLEAEATAKAEAEERAARTEERLAKVKEVANFPEEFVASQTERWIAMSDEDFESTVEGYKVAAEAAKAAMSVTEEKADTAGSDALAETAMKAEREEEVSGGKFDTVRALMRNSRSGRMDPRTV